MFDEISDLIWDYVESWYVFERRCFICDGDEEDTAGADVKA